MKYISDWEGTNHFEITTKNGSPFWHIDKLIDEILRGVILSRDQRNCINNNISFEKPYQKILGKMMDALVEKLNNDKQNKENEVEE